MNLQGLQRTHLQTSWHTGAPPASKFQDFNEQWLEQTEDMAADFVNTPSMEHLKAGTFGAVLVLRPAWLVTRLLLNVSHRVLSHREPLKNSRDNPAAGLIFPPWTTPKLTTQCMMLYAPCCREVVSCRSRVRPHSGHQHSGARDTGAVPAHAERDPHHRHVPRGRHPSQCASLRPCLLRYQASDRLAAMQRCIVQCGVVLVLRPDYPVAHSNLAVCSHSVAVAGANADCTLRLQ